MQLAREPLPLELLSSDDAPERVRCHSSRQIDRDRSARRELLRESQVVVPEAWIRTKLVVRDDHADRLVPREERHVETGPRAELSRGVLVDFGIVDQRVDALAVSAREHASGLRRGAWKRYADHRVRVLACRRLEAALLTRGQRDRDVSRFDQLAKAA